MKSGTLGRGRLTAPTLLAVVMLAACASGGTGQGSARVSGSPSMSATEDPSTMPFHTVNETAETSDVGADVFRFLATSEQTGGGYSAIEVEIAANSGSPGAHRHDAAEAFFVIEGTVVFQIDDQGFEASAGDFVHIPAGSTHTVRTLDEPARVLAIFVPGGEEEQFRSAP
jgi:quercetin dioxygenase-like cupin family protein